MKSRPLTVGHYGSTDVPYVVKYEEVARVTSNAWDPRTISTKNVAMHGYKLDEALPEKSSCHALLKASLRPCTQKRSFLSFLAENQRPLQFGTPCSFFKRAGEILNDDRQNFWSLSMKVKAFKVESLKTTSMVTDPSIIRYATQEIR